MRLGVRDSFLAVPPVGEREAQPAHVPVDILLLLQPLDIQIRHRHRESIIKPHPSQTQTHTQRRHARHVLRDGDAIPRVQRMQQLVGKHHIHDAVFVHARAEVLVISPAEACPDAVVGVEHGSDAVEAKPIELILLHPEAQVTQQKPQNLVRAVVKESRVPEFVPPPRALVEVLVVATVEHVQAVEDVLGGVRVHDVQQDGDAHAVGGVDEFFEVFGVAVAGGGGEEGVDLVAEGGVVGVFHHRHQLDGVVSQVSYPGEGVLGEFFVGCDFGLRGGDADVGFVDAGGGGFGGARVLEVVGLGRVVEAGVVDGADV